MLKSTINTEAGQVVIVPGIGRVVVNSASMLPHEARLFALELARAAQSADDQAAQSVESATAAA